MSCPLGRLASPSNSKHPSLYESWYNMALFVHLREICMHMWLEHTTTSYHITTAWRASSSCFDPACVNMTTRRTQSSVAKNTKQCHEYCFLVTKRMMNSASMIIGAIIASVVSSVYSSSMMTGKHLCHKNKWLPGLPLEGYS